MSKLLLLKKPLIWIKRFRHRCGYGVHSPFAFNFITNIIYEKTLYYAYTDIEENKAKKYPFESKKLNRLLFRLVNWSQPKTIVDVGGNQSNSPYYLKAAKKGAEYISVTDISTLNSIKDLPIDFLYIHYNNHAEFAKEVFYRSIEHITEKSVFVIQGIRYSQAMKKLWSDIINEDKVGITFDLYDAGIILFDKSKIKQQYIVNF